MQAPTLPPILLARAPAPTRQQVAAATYRAAPPPKAAKPAYVPPAPPAPQALSTANNPRGVAIIQPPSKPTVNDLHAQAVASTFHDAGPTGNYGTAAANAFKKTDAYKQSVLETFLHQNAYQRQAIVSGALHNTASPEAKMILDYVKRTGGGATGGSNLVPAAVYGSVLRSGIGPMSGFAKVVQNAARDIVTMPSGTLQGLWSLGKQGAQGIGDLASGNVSGALSHYETAGKQIADPFVQLAEHPIRTFEQHPVNTLLMASGLKSLIGRSVGAAGRAAGADWASTQRAPLSLGTVSGEPATAPGLVEARSYSNDAINQAVQRAREKTLAARGQNPNIARPVPRIPFTQTPVLPAALRQAFNVGPEAKLLRKADEMAAVRQTLGRVERGRALKEVHDAAPKAKEAHNVVTHILQGVIRNPDTAIADIAAEIKRLRAVRTHTRSQGGKWNRLQVKDLETAAKTPGALEQAFATAERLRPTMHGQDNVLAAKRILTPDQLEAKYFPYAQAHMGALYDHETGQLIAPTGTMHQGAPLYKPLSTDEIRAHLQGYRDVSNPEFDRASRVRENTDRVLRTRQAAHNQSAAEYRAAVAHHRNVSAIDQGQPTPLEIQKLTILRALRDRPGTPGEGAAAQAAMDRIEAKIRERGGAGDPAALRAAQDRLAKANAERQRTRADLNNARESSRRAQSDLAETPRTVSRKVSPEVPDPAYVGHYENKATPGQFYQRYTGTRGTLSKGKRTGEAFRKGAYDHTYEGLAGQLAARAEAVTKASLHDRVISQLGMLKPKEVVAKEVREQWARARQRIKDNPAQRDRIIAATRKETADIKTGMYTPAEARAAVYAQPRDDFHNVIGSELEMTPLAAAPLKSIDWVRDIQHPNQLQGISDIESQALTRAIDEAAGRTDGTRNVVLAPSESIQRLADQFRPQPRSLAKRSVYQFRNTVLPYSTHWMFQIGSEAGIRAALAGVLSPHYLMDARRLMNRLMETEQGRAVMAETTGHGGFYGQRGTMGIYHDPNALTGFMNRFAPTRGIIKANNAYGDFVSKAMGGLEHNFRLMGLGKLAHGEIREFGNSWRGAIRLQGQMLEQIAQRLEADPALVAKFGRQIDHMFGQYSKYSPTVRAAIQGYAPFLPWYLTATKYVFWQLPVHHPVSSALLASLRQTVNQDVADGKAQPLNAFATQALGTLSPFGIFTPTSGKPKDVASELVQKGVSLSLPQAQGAFLALGGDNPFFGRLQGPHGQVKGLSPQALSTAAESAIEAGVPLATKLRQVLEGGRPSYGTSALWSPQPKTDGGPGDLSQILNRTLNPFYSFQRAKGAKPPSTSTGGSSGIGMKKFGSGGGGIGMKKFSG